MRLLILVQMGVDAYDLGSVDGSGYDSGFPGGDGSALREHLPQNAGQSEERGLPTSPRSPTARQVAFAEGDWAPLQSIRFDLHPKHFTIGSAPTLGGQDDQREALAVIRSLLLRSRGSFHDLPTLRPDIR